MESSLKKIIVIIGPTASGKTDLGFKLSANLPVEFISADSRQVYKFLNIGTAKPTQEELLTYRHHFVDILNPDEYFSAGVFAGLARETIHKILSDGKIPIVLGGSGLYIKALFDGLFNFNSELENKESFKRMFDENQDREVLYAKLKEIDPPAASKYHDKNPVRLLRAIDHFYQTGERISDSWQNQNRFDVEPVYFGISYSREKLYDRINLRTEKMFASGIIEELNHVLSLGYRQDLNSLNTVGYKEAGAFLRGECTLETSVDETKKNTRRYAKRQITWFKKVQQVHWFDGENPYIADEILKICSNLKIF